MADLTGTVPDRGSDTADGEAAASTVPMMSICFNGTTHWLEVRPGTGGVEAFKDDVRRLLGLAPTQAFDITFECMVPSSCSE